jgi:hypothetical protein
MKKIALLITTCFLATISFANTTTNPSKSTRAISDAWKANNVSGVNLEHDMNIVYGGQDVSPRHELVSANMTA